MEIFVYKEGAAEVEEGFKAAELPELLKDKDNVVWVDLLGETAEQVEEAKDIIESERKSSRSKELIIILGSTFFGAFAQELIPKLSSGEQNYSPISIGFGLIGLFMVVWNLRR